MSRICTRNISMKRQTRIVTKKTIQRTTFPEFIQRKIRIRK